MTYQAFTLKYRPRTFEDIVGQEHISRTLRNAVSTGRIHHAYLFTGPRGTGKTTTARVLARALNCVNGPTPDPCGVCEACISILEGRAMDVVEMDAASNRGVDDIRDLREKVKYGAAQHRVKLYILDECHMLTREAWNALLKTLEEPPEHVYFALLTTEVNNVPSTILSRCQRYNFRPISLPDQIRALRRVAEQEGIAVEDDALAAIARAAEGAMRDAESILEQAVAYSEGNITLETVHRMLGVTETELLAEIAETVARQDLAGAFAVVDRLVARGKDLERLIEDLTAFLRDLLRLALGTEAEAWLQLGAGSRQRMTELATTLGPERLLAALNALTELRGKLRDSSQHSLLLEMALVGLIRQPTTSSTSRPVPAPAIQPAAVLPTETVPPAPSPAAFTPAEAGKSALTIELVREHWEALGTQLRRMGQIPLAAFLKEATPVQFEGDTLTIQFPEQYKFHYTKVRDDYHQTVVEALSKLFRRPLMLVCELLEVTPEPMATARVEPPLVPPEPEFGLEATPDSTSEPAMATTPTVTAQEPEVVTPEPSSPLPPDKPLTADEAVGQTLSLFAGAEEVLPDPPKTDSD